MWIYKSNDRTGDYYNKTNFNFGKLPTLIYDLIWFDMEDYRRMAFRKHPFSWIGRRAEKIYTLKVAKTSEMLKRVSVMKTKGVYKFKKYYYTKQLNNKLLDCNHIFNTNKKLEKIKVNDDIFYAEDNYYELEADDNSELNYDLYLQDFEAALIEINNFITNFDLDTKCRINVYNMEDIYNRLETDSTLSLNDVFELNVEDTDDVDDDDNIPVFII